MLLRLGQLTTLLYGLSACSGTDRLLSSTVAPAAVQDTLSSHAVDERPQLGSALPAGAAFRVSGAQLLYVANNGNRSVTVYPALANGNVPPLRRIVGSTTRIYGTIGGLAQDGAGNLYVGEHQNGILVFAPGANGNVAPIRRIFGSNTTLGNVQALAVDAAGNIFAATEVFAGGRPSYARLLRFPAGANGNVAPAAALIAGQEVNAIALDTTGTNIVVTAPALQSSSGSNTYTFSRAFTNDAAALYDVGGFVGGAVVSDPGNASYFEYSFDQNEVARFANGTQGTAYPGGFASLMPPPKQALFISPAGLAIDASRNLYASFGALGTGNVDVYANTASGSAGMLRQISGADTLLSQPQSIYVGR